MRFPFKLFHKSTSYATSTFTKKNISTYFRFWNFDHILPEFSLFSICAHKLIQTMNTKPKIVQNYDFKHSYPTHTNLILKETHRSCSCTQFCICRWTGFPQILCRLRSCFLYRGGKLTISTIYKGCLYLFLSVGTIVIVSNLSQSVPIVNTLASVQY